MSSIVLCCVLNVMMLIACDVLHDSGSEVATLSGQLSARLSPATLVSLHTLA